MKQFALAELYKVKSRDTAVKALREVEQALKAFAAVPEGD
jgi:hypothetical protein